MDVSWQPELLMEFGSLDLTLNPWGRINHDKNWMPKAFRVLGRAVSTSQNGCFWSIYRHEKSWWGCLGHYHHSFWFKGNFYGPRNCRFPPPSLPCWGAPIRSGFQTGRGSVVFISEQGEGWDIPSLVALRWPLPGWGLCDAEQRAGMCCSTQGRAFPTADPEPTFPKENFSIVYVKVKFDPWN